MTAGMGPAHARGRLVHRSNVGLRIRGRTRRKRKVVRRRGRARLQTEGPALWRSVKSGGRDTYTAGLRTKVAEPLSGVRLAGVDLWSYRQVSSGNGDERDDGEREREKAFAEVNPYRNDDHTRMPANVKNSFLPNNSFSRSPILWFTVLSQKNHFHPIAVVSAKKRKT